MLPTLRSFVSNRFNFVLGVQADSELSGYAKLAQEYSPNIEEN
jgi:hypothetical protein